MTSTTGESLTIGDLAERTGLTHATLRMWERRHGFPEPHRLESGHRRYSDSDVLAVRRVLDRQESGIRLDKAIEQVRADTTAEAVVSSPSVYVELRQRHPHLPAHRLSKGTLLALSWAIEDEFMARADRPHLFGSFQRGRYFLESQDRWTELARIARSAYVLGAFDDDGDGHEDGGATVPAERVGRGTAGPVRVHLPDTSPMRREWAVVCDSPDLPIVLTAWELPGQSGVRDRDRVFESMWTIDPMAVRHASRVCAQVARGAGVAEAARTLYELADDPRPGVVDLAAVSAMFNRLLAYVDRYGPGSR